MHSPAPLRINQTSKKNKIKKQKSLTLSWKSLAALTDINKSRWDVHVEVLAWTLWSDLGRWVLPLRHPGPVISTLSPRVNIGVTYWKKKTRHRGSFQEYISPHVCQSSKNADLPKNHHQSSMRGGGCVWGAEQSRCWWVTAEDFTLFFFFWRIQVILGIYL